MASDLKMDTSGLDRLISATPEQLDRWLASVASEITDEIKLSFNTSAPGRTYRRRSVTHTASVAGSPPNVDIGTLRASMHNYRSGDLEYTVSDGVEYGEFLEFGTESIEPRPFMSPVFNRWAAGELLNSARNAGLLK